MRLSEIETGEVVEAVQYVEGEKPPKGVVVEDDAATVVTKDTDGPVDIAPGTWVLTHEDGTVSLAAPAAIDRWFEEA